MQYIDDECDECEGLNVVSKLVAIERIGDEMVPHEVVRHWYEYQCRDCFATFRDWKEIQPND